MPRLDLGISWKLVQEGQTQDDVALGTVEVDEQWARLGSQGRVLVTGYDRELQPILNMQELPDPENEGSRLVPQKMRMQPADSDGTQLQRFATYLSKSRKAGKAVLATGEMLVLHPSSSPSGAPLLAVVYTRQQAPSRQGGEGGGGAPSLVETQGQSSAARTLTRPREEDHPGTSAGLAGRKRPRDDPEEDRVQEYMCRIDERLRSKIEGKRSYFFGALARGDRNQQRRGSDLIRQIQMDEEASYSVTEMNLAEQCSRAIKEVMPSSMPPSERCCVTDATACVGGNVINFERNFGRVNAIENDALRAGMLQHNIDVVCRSPGKVTVYEADALQKVPELKQDILFMDPPWGGPGYTENDRLQLFLSGKTLSEVCKGFKGMAKLLVLKVPYNFDKQEFVASCRHAWAEVTERHIGHREGTAKFHLLVFKAVVE